jgi:3-isopropylmalate/(R)-2-methylmalate dehydratase small subunit
MEDADPNFVKEFRVGDIVVAGENFGCGSSREHAPIALKAAGVSAVVAKSFARIFYRNAFNMGLPIFELDEIDKIEKDDLIRINMEDGTVTDMNKHKSYDFMPIPDFMQELLNSGGLMNYAKAEILAKEENN